MGAVRFVWHVVSVEIGHDGQCTAASKLPQGVQTRGGDSIIGTTVVKSNGWEYSGIRGWFVQAIDDGGHDVLAGHHVLGRLLLLQGLGKVHDVVLDGHCAVALLVGDIVGGLDCRFGEFVEDVDQGVRGLIDLGVVKEHAQGSGAAVLVPTPFQGGSAIMAVAGRAGAGAASVVLFPYGGQGRDLADGLGGRFLMVGMVATACVGLERRQGDVGGLGKAFETLEGRKWCVVGGGFVVWGSVWIIQ